MTELDTQAAPAPKPRSVRRLLGLLVRGPVGCLSFLAGAVLVLVAVTPTVVSRYGPEATEDVFEEIYAGDLDVDRIGLSWLSRQEIGAVSLADPDGSRVFEGSVSFPSLLALLGGGSLDLGRLRLDVTSVQLERDEEGVWNIARALARRPDPDVQGQINVETPNRPGQGPLAGLVPYEGELELLVRELRIADRSEEGPEEPLTIEELAVQLTLASGRSTTLEGSGRIASPLPGRIEISGELESGDGLADAIPVRRLDVSVDRISVDWVDRFLGQEGRLLELVGPVARASVALAQGGDGSGPLGARVELEGARATATLRLKVDGGHLVLDRSSPSTVELLDPGALAAGYVDAALPDHLTLRAGAEAIVLTLDDFSFPLPFALGGSRDAAAGVAGLDLAAMVNLGPWNLDTPTGSLGIRTARIGANLAPATGLRASLVASTVGVGGLDDGALTVDLTTTPLADLAAAVELGRDPGVELDLSLVDVPTAPIDAALSADGFLSDLLGERLTVDGALRPTADQGVWAATLRASTPLAELDLVGRIEGGRLVASDGRPASIAFDLTPLSSPRVVGSVLPLLAAVEKPDGAERSTILLGDYALPLDGDLAGLSGDLVLDLGAVSARWLPQLGLGVENLLEPLDLDPVRARIEGGRLVHEGFEVSIRGRQVPFLGSVDLTTGEASFDAQVPLDAIGGDLGKLLDGLRESGEGDLVLPLAIRGRWPSVTAELDSSALGGRVTELLGEELTGQLGEELSGQLGEALGSGIGEAIGDELGEEITGGLRSLLEALKGDG